MCEMFEGQKHLGNGGNQVASPKLNKIAPEKIMRLEDDPSLLGPGRVSGANSLLSHDP